MAAGKSAANPDEVINKKELPVLYSEQPGPLRRLVDLVWLLGIVTRGSPKAAGVWALAALASGLLVPAQLWSTKNLVDAIAARVGGSEGGPLLFWLLLLIGALIAERLVGGFMPLLQERVRDESGARIQEQVMKKASQIELVAFEHQAYYDQLRRAMDDAEGRGPRLLQTALSVIRLIPEFLGYAVALWIVAPTLLVIVLAAGTPAIWSIVSIGQRSWDALRDQTRDRRLSDYYADLLTDRAFAKEVRLYNLSEHVISRWSELYWMTRNEYRRHTALLGLRERSSILISFTAMLAGLWWVVTSGIAGATAGAYALLFQSLIGAFDGLFQIASAGRTLGAESGYASDLRMFMSLKPPPPPPAPIPFPRPIIQGIRFDDVWFTYPGADRPALAGVSFVIRPGESVALVGENGAGKTTLVKLLMGLYRPDRGRVTVDGRDLAEYDPDSVRREMSAIMQHFVRYRLTLKENILLDRADAKEVGHRLDQAARWAGVMPLLDKLEKGYDTLLGPDVDGVDLSGGEWQRVALARAFVRDAQVLVLDEPTAALDPLAELSIFERFVELSQGRTALLISHRLGMARLADRVLVLDDGRLVEDGTHDQLIAKGAVYAALFDAQARWYA